MVLPGFFPAPEIFAKLFPGFADVSFTDVKWIKRSLLEMAAVMALLLFAGTAMGATHLLLPNVGAPQPRVGSGVR